MGEHRSMDRGGGGGGAATTCLGRAAHVPALPPWTLAAALGPAAPRAGAAGAGWRARVQGAGTPGVGQEGDATAIRETPQSAPGGLNTDQGSPRPAQSGDPPPSGARSAAWQVPDVVSLSCSRGAPGAAKSARTSLIPPHVLCAFVRSGGGPSAAAASPKSAPGAHSNTYAAPGSNVPPAGHQKEAQVTQKHVATPQKTSKAEDHRPQGRPSTTPADSSVPRSGHGTLSDTCKPLWRPTAVPGDHKTAHEPLGSKVHQSGRQQGGHAAQKPTANFQNTFIKVDNHKPEVKYSTTPVNFSTAMGQHPPHLGASKPNYGTTNRAGEHTTKFALLGSQTGFSDAKEASHITQKYKVTPQTDSIKRDGCRSRVSPIPADSIDVRGQSATRLLPEKSIQLRRAEQKIETFSGRSKSGMKALTPIKDHSQKFRSRSKSPLGVSHHSSRDSSFPLKRSKRGQSSSSSTSSRSSDSQSASSSSSRSCRSSQSSSSSTSPHRRQSPLTRFSDSSSLKRTSQLTHSSHSRSPSPKKKSVKWLDSSLSRSETTTKKENHSAYSSSSRSRSPIRRGSKTSHSTRSRSRSFSKRGRLSSQSSSSRSRSPPERDSTSSDSSSESYHHRSRSSRHRSSSHRRATSRSPDSQSRRRQTRCSSHSSRSRSSSPGLKGKSSSRSAKSPSKSTHHTASPEKLHTEENVPLRSFGVKIDISELVNDDKCVKDRIYQMFMIYGLVTSVEILTQSTKKYAVVFFSRPYEQQSALFSAPKTLFNKKLSVSPWTEKDQENQQNFEKKGRRNVSRWSDAKARDSNATTMWDNPMIQFHPRSSRMLLIDDLPKTIAPEKLDTVCARFENILDIDVQESPGKAACCFAVVEFSDIISLINAAKALDEEFFGGFNVKVDFGESAQTNCMWIDGIPACLLWEDMLVVLRQYGAVAKMLRDSIRSRALILYERRQDAVFAVKQLKLRNVFKSWVMVDFASDRSQLAFCRSMEASGQDIGNFLSE
ncbi:hypothetical protein NDU88_000123 [Pleurodeles waltl]|uniref:RRM domain-containing protein n=1 Tax=Pleurodeles waltl TaxID=8319 RepID=A0AAV7KLI6_PLEWA|nr:hypothetical protein NDU88_000123 [Pleurodeles waltl]